MGDAVSCRIANKTDLPEILRLYAQPDLDDGEVLSPFEAEAVLDRFCDYPDYSLFVAIRYGRVVGSFALLIMDNIGHMGARSGIVEDFVVDPSLQRQGIGTAMMRFALGLAAEAGCYKVMLSSNMKRERAHAFYESLGFERHGYSYRVAALPVIQPDREDTAS